ncbi:hypothetical protein G7Y89_g5047 [Cudoniella acicularis]|uniref:Uncharacterized protein n=1 Tax=Cudoniella acicularis TaxID=354080 RepID=A0A8H4RPK5_9HELO|nr:hypothetical protein G7Y89_g5047 [Cudoniella acicularis]
MSLSDDKSIDAESNTDYSNLDVDLIAKGDSYSLYIIDSDPADGDSFGSGTTLISDRLVADHQDDGNDIDNGVADSAKL